MASSKVHSAMLGTLRSRRFLPWIPWTAIVVERKFAGHLWTSKHIRRPDSNGKNLLLDSRALTANDSIWVQYCLETERSGAVLQWHQGSGSVWGGTRPHIEKDFSLRSK